MQVSELPQSLLSLCNVPTVQLNVWNRLTSQGHYTFDEIIIFSRNFYCFELALKKFVTDFQTYRCGKEFAFLTLACLGTYAAFTLSITQWR